jgi:hypothetical protein
MLTRSSLQIPIRTQYLLTLFQRILNLARREQTRGRCVRPVVLSIIMQQSELVIVYHSCVESPNGELEGAPHVVDPCDALKANVVFFRIAHVDVSETLLDSGLQYVGFRNFDVRRMRADEIVGGCGCHGGVVGEILGSARLRDESKRNVQVESTQSLDWRS